MDFKKLPSTTPPLWPQNTQIHFTTQKKDEKEKKRGKKKTRKNEEARELVTSVSNARRRRIGNTFCWKEQELLRVAQEHQHEREKERERKGGSRERDEDDWQWPVVMVSRQEWDLKW